MGNLQNSKIP